MLLVNCKLLLGILFRIICLSVPYWVTLWIFTPCLKTLFWITPANKLVPATLLLRRCRNIEFTIRIRKEIVGDDRLNKK